MVAECRRFSGRSVWILTCLGLGLLMAAAFGHALRVPFGHDEHQFVAGGALLAKGLIPYRDFPLHHLPYQLAVYALPALVTGRLLLAARLISGFFAAGSMLLVFIIVWNRWRQKVGRWAPLAGLASAVALAASPLFDYTSGRAWNHDLSVFLVLVSLGILLWRDRLSGTSVLFSGIALGLATGTRLTAGLAAVPMLLYLLAERQSNFPRLGSAIWRFATGFSIALVPAGGLALLAPRPFYYGNWTYHKLNTIYRQLLDHGNSMSLLGKGRYFLGRVVMEPGHLLLLAGILLVIIYAIFRSDRLSLFSPNTILAFSISSFLFLGSLLPTPSWPQYFYGPLPFLILGIFMGLADHTSHEEKSVVLPAIMLVGALAMATFRSGFDKDWGALIQPSETTVAEVHRIVEAIDQEIDAGRVVTLAPIFPLGAGASIEPALAPGPFAYRVAPLLVPLTRERYGLLGPQELVAKMEVNPPSAVLSGVESGNIGLASDPQENIEDPLIDFAQSHGYQPVMIPNDVYNQDLILWLAPE